MVMFLCRLSTALLFIDTDNISCFILAEVAVVAVIVKVLVLVVVVVVVVVV